MRFADIGNVWTVDLSVLSNADRGRVYFERAKQVVAEALHDPHERVQAVEGRRFRRDYLVEKIGSQPAVTTQNPKIKKLLFDTDRQLDQQAGQGRTVGSRLPRCQSREVGELRGSIDKLRRLVEVQAAEITSLRRQLKEANLIEIDWVNQGRITK